MRIQNLCLIASFDHSVALLLPPQSVIGLRALGHVYGTYGRIQMVISIIYRSLIVFLRSIS
jgi:hypothetical protein